MFHNTTPINPIDKTLTEPYFDTCQNMSMNNGKDLLETATQLWQNSLDMCYPTKNPFEWLLDQKTMVEKKKKLDQWYDENITDDRMIFLLHYGNKNQVYYQFMADSFPKEFDKEFWMNILVNCAIVASPKESEKTKNQVKKATDEEVKIIRREELLKEFFSQEANKKEPELKKVHHEIFVEEAYSLY